MSISHEKYRQVKTHDASSDDVMLTKNNILNDVKQNIGQNLGQI